MTDPKRADHVRELQQLEAALANRITFVRVIISPTFAPGADRYAAPTGWTVTDRIVRNYHSHHTYSKEQT